MTDYRWFAATLCILATALAACAAADRRMPAEPAPVVKTPNESPRPAQDKVARAAAADEMIRRGRDLLEKGDAAAAIRVLGRAVHLKPTDGEVYYYISEAWIMQQNVYQAQQYNRLAERYLGNDPHWITRLARQSDRIDELRQ